MTMKRRMRMLIVEGISLVWLFVFPSWPSFCVILDPGTKICTVARYIGPRVIMT